MTKTIGRAISLPRSIALAGTALVLSLGMMAPAAAQATDPAPEAGQAEFSGNKLDAFVAALMEVDAVRKSFVPQIEAAESETAQAELVEAANAEIVERIEATPDMSVDEYVTIAQLAQQDQALNERILSRVQTATE